MYNVATKMFIQSKTEQDMIIKSHEEKDILMTEPNLTNSGKEIFGKDPSRPATYKSSLNTVT
jgi:hypothetical protein